jgi:hypothetical protein
MEDLVAEARHEIAVDQAAAVGSATAAASAGAAEGRQENAPAADEEKQDKEPEQT